MLPDLLARANSINAIGYTDVFILYVVEPADGGVLYSILHPFDPELDIPSRVFSAFNEVTPVPPLVRGSVPEVMLLAL